MLMRFPFLHFMILGQRACQIFGNELLHTITGGLSKFASTLDSFREECLSLPVESFQDTLNKHFIVNLFRNHNFKIILKL